MEIFPNVHEIRSVFGDRYIQQYLFVGERIVLLDAGVFATPEAAIFPYLKKIGIAPENCRWWWPCTRMPITTADCRQLKMLRVPLCWPAIRGSES